MAPGLSNKRPRANTDGVDNRGKRLRRSESDESDSEASAEVSEKTPEDESQPEAEDRVVIDAAEEKRLYARQTQRIERERREDLDKVNIPSECGIIQEISCTNFMCHVQLTVTLGPLINFIIGHNGSGKSAVLTALTLCLGGKASATNRGSSLKNFIKEGTEQSVLRVKIKNEGLSAYKPDVYGKSIYVERHFNRANASGFRLRDENKKIVSTKKAELEDIIDAFALQIDNPMNVLTQDMARQFLNESTPKQKYQFFLTGTQLKTLADDYSMITQQSDEIETKLETTAADITVLHKQFLAAQEKAQQAANLERAKERETALAHQAIWARVEEEEAVVEQDEKEVEIITNSMQEREVAADGFSAEYEQANQAYSDLNQTISDQQQALDPKTAECEELAEQLRATKTSLHQIHAQEKVLHAKVKSKESLIRRTQTSIEEQLRRQAEANDGHQAQMQHELDAAKEEVAHTKQSLDNLESELQGLKDDFRAAQAQKSQVDARKREQQADIQQARANIKNLEQGQRDWTAAYGNGGQLVKLLQAIDAERQFRVKPVGPIGRYVKLLKPEWASILESQFGPTLNAFVVTSKYDLNILSGMMKRFNVYKHSISICQDRQINTSGHEPNPDLLTWLRVLSINNNLVRNQIIVQHSLDQIVLIENREEGQQFMLRGGAAKRNVKLCFTMADVGSTKGHTISVNSHSGSMNINPIRTYAGPHRMQADKEPQLRAAISHLERLQHAQDVPEEAENPQVRVDACQKRLRDHDRQTRALNVQLQRAESQVERLESEMSAATSDFGVVAQLHDDLKRAQEELQFAEGQFEDLVASKDRHNETAREQKNALEAVQRELQQLNIVLGKSTRRADKLASERETALAGKNRALQSVENARGVQADWLRKLGEDKAQLEVTLTDAEQICGRVEVPQGATHDRLMSKLARMTAQREISERELGGSQLELIDIANAAKKAYVDANNERKGTEEILRTLKQSIAHRNERWRKFRQDISVRATVHFGYLLMDRQYRGKMVIDHESKQLVVNIEPDITSLSETGRDVKSLSGGEKSFSTICLLLSLWEAMGSPIRCLDEFDVFMDSVNRDITMKMMIQAARSAIGRQYILITPQGMNSVQSVDDVKIIKMHDPERGQTALNLVTT